MTEDKPIHETYDEQIAASAKKALEAIPPEEEEATRAARAQLMSWLIHTYERAAPKLEGVLGEESANVAADVLEKAVVQLGKLADDGGKAKLETFMRSFSDLDSGSQLGIVHAIVVETLRASATDSVVVSRNVSRSRTPGSVPLNSPWQVVGFSVNGATECVMAKVGTEIGQPIGFDDGERYVGTEGSKLLWARDWGIAVVLPWAPPFHVERTELEPQRISDDYRLSDKDIAKISNTLEMFDHDLSEWQNKPDDRPTIEDRMRESVKLSRVQLPILDQMLEKFYDEHPEIGYNLENVDVVQSVVSCREFLQLKIDDDAQRRRVESTLLSVATSASEGQLRLIDDLLSSLSGLLPPEGADISDEDAVGIQRALDSAGMAVPEVWDRFAQLQADDEDATVLDALKAAILTLHEKKDALLSASATGSDADAGTDVPEDNETSEDT